MTGLEFLRASGTTVEEIADVISSPCPPVIPEKCDRLSCRECWIAWLTTGEPPKAKGPSDEQTAPGESPTCYRPPVKAIQEAANRVREGNLEYTAAALTRHRENEEPRQP